MQMLRVVYPKRKREKPAREFLSLLGPFDPRQYRKRPARTRTGTATEPARIEAVCAWLDSE